MQLAESRLGLDCQHQNQYSSCYCKTKALWEILLGGGLTSLEGRLTTIPCGSLVLPFPISLQYLAINHDFQGYLCFLLCRTRKGCLRRLHAPVARWEGAMQVFWGRQPSGWDHCKREGNLGTLPELGEAIRVARAEPQCGVLVRNPEPEWCTVQVVDLNFLCVSSTALSTQRTRSHDLFLPTSHKCGAVCIHVYCIHKDTCKSSPALSPGRYLTISPKKVRVVFISWGPVPTYLVFSGA